MKMRTSALAFAGLAAVANATLPIRDAEAHGFAGKRFFPATLAIDDPFVADELSLPTVSTLRAPAKGEEPSTRETDYSVDWAKTITRNFGLSVGESLVHLNPRGDHSHTGFQNLAVGAKYQFFLNEPHEAVASFQLEAEIGGTGTDRIGAEHHSTIGPAILFGKGLGDLPPALSMLRPIALTGGVGVEIPTAAHSGPADAREANPHVLTWGFAVEYSIPYLQSQVRDMGWRAPFDRLIPIVEFALATPLDRGEGGRTEGTINPGLLWAGQHIQLGAEALIPINSRSGRGVGVLGQLHFYLDDLFPKSLGRPLFH